MEKEKKERNVQGGQDRKYPFGFGKYSFVQLLDLKEFHLSFTEYCRESSEENLLFYDAVKELVSRKLDEKEWTEEARKIYKKHLRMDAPYEVNLDAAYVLVLRMAFEGPKSPLVPHDVFAPAQASIGKLLEHEILPNFLKTDSFKEAEEKFEENEMTPFQKTSRYLAWIVWVVIHTLALIGVVFLFLKLISFVFVAPVSSSEAPKCPFGHG